MLLVEWMDQGYGPEIERAMNVAAGLTRSLMSLAVLLVLSANAVLKFAPSLFKEKSQNG